MAHNNSANGVERGLLHMWNIADMLVVYWEQNWL